MKVLITGGAGFIGSHLAERLLADGMTVDALDDLSTGDIENIRHLLDLPGFRFVRGSVLDVDLIDAHVRACDRVVHLGAAVGVKLVVKRPIHTIETNVKGTQVVLGAASRHGRPVFVASTSEVYGRGESSTGRRFKETDDLTVGPSTRWCYASSKLLDEHLAHAYFVEQGLPVVVGRFFNTVGPRQSGTYGMVIPRFVQQALAGEALTIYGDGAQVRTFTWVGDAVRAVRALMDHPAAVGETFNIGSDEPVTIRELAERVRGLAKSSSEIKYIQYAEAYGAGFDDVRYRVPDISKLRTTIAYRPSKTLDGILREMIGYFETSRIEEIR